MVYSLYMKSNIFTRISTFVFWCFIVYCGIISGLWIYERPLIGDDLFYASDLEVRGGDLLALPHLMAAIFMGCNGRWGDITNTVWLVLLPRLVTAIFAFIFAVLLPWAAVKLSGLKLKYTIPVSLLAMMIVFLLPWWDMSHLVCMINYPWGAAVVLVCLIPILGNYKLKNKWWIIGLPIAWMGAAWHEASGVPLAVGLLLWCCLDGEWNHFSPIKKWWIVAMIVGGLFTVTSPAIWNRLISKDPQEYSIVNLLLESANLSVVLFAGILSIFFVNRKLFNKLLKDNFVVFATASIVSACIVMVGGVSGRSGLFAQIFGAIALMRIMVVSGKIPYGNNAISVILAILLYLVAGCYVTQSYNRDLEVTRILKESEVVYPQDHKVAYSLIMSLPDMDQWDAASLKVYDPRYDYRVDRTDSLKLNAEK